KAIGYAPLLAAAELRVGIERSDGDRYAPAQEALEDATVAAEAARDDETAARAWTYQVSNLGSLHRFDDAHRAAKHAAALLSRGAIGPAREADLENHLGFLAEAEGHY